MLAVAGGKGGCGKTTVTLGLALALARRGRRPLAVDADVDVPDLHVRAGVDPEPGLDAVGAGRSPEALAQPSTDVPGVDVLPAGWTSRCPAATLATLRDLARPVIVDCPAGAGPDAAAPLRRADACILVTTTAPESRQDAAKTAAMADSLDAPVAATVRRVVGEDPAASPATGPAHSSGGPAQAHTGSGDVPVVTVPTVADRPLRDPGLLDGFDRLRRRIARRVSTRGPAARRP